MHLVVETKQNHQEAVYRHQPLDRDNTLRGIRQQVFYRTLTSKQKLHLKNWHQHINSKISHQTAPFSNNIKNKNKNH